MPDLDLRLVRYFTVVAEHEHFGRAAEELLVAQPSLSRQVRRLEEQVGARLLDRTPQGSTLTPAGRAFLARAKALLHDADIAVAEARRPADRLVVGFAGDLLVTAAVRAVRHHHPDAEVTTRHLDWHDAADALHDHRVDVAVARLPVEPPGIDVHPLYDLPRVLVVPLDHRLAGKESVRLDDFADEVMVSMADPELDAFWRVLPRPDGRTPPRGPVVTSPEDKFELVAAGDAVTLSPSRPQRPDLTWIPVEDVAPVRVAVAHRAGEDSALLRAFRRAAQEHLVPVEV